jgi:hypothetical protein
MTVPQVLLLVLEIAGIALLSVLAGAQAAGNRRLSSSRVASASSAQPDLTYARPTEEPKRPHGAPNPWGA